MLTATETAPAWAFVLRHAGLISRMARRFDAGLDPADFRAEVVADLAATFGKYDPTRCAPSTWIFMRARAIRRASVRASIRGNAISLSEPVAEGSTETREAALSAPVVGRRSAAQAEARAVLATLIDESNLNERQALACRSHLAGWDRERLKRAGFPTRAARDRVLRTIAP